MVFTDVVGSSRLLECIGDERWAALWAELGRLVGGLARRLDGEVLKSLGDGHMVAFADTRAAVSFGVELQRKLEDRDVLELPVTLRLGMHVGEVIHTDNDMHGRTVHVAARIAALAAPGDLLCSGAVRDVVSANGPWTFGAPRKAALRGLGGMHEVVALRWDLGASSARHLRS